jgi:hypothetical protein
MPLIQKLPGPFPPRWFAGSWFARSWFPGAIAAARAYSPPSVTGWKSSVRRRGPDPNFTTIARAKGLGVN